MKRERVSERVSECESVRVRVRLRQHIRVYRRGISRACTDESPCACTDEALTAKHKTCQRKSIHT